MQRAVGLAVVIGMVGCGSSGGKVDEFASAVKPAASTANLLANELSSWNTGHHLPTELFASDGPLVQLVTLFSELASMPRVAGLTGAAKVCADGFYGATDQLKAAVTSTATALGDLKGKASDAPLGTLMKLAGQWETTEHDFDAAICALGKAASACVAPLKQANVDSQLFTLLAMTGANRKCP